MIDELKLPLPEDLKSEAPEKIVLFSDLCSNNITIPPSLVIHPQTFQKIFDQLTQSFINQSQKDNFFEFTLFTKDLISKHLSTIGEDSQLKKIAPKNFSRFTLTLFFQPFDFIIKNDDCDDLKLAIVQSLAKFWPNFNFIAQQSKPIFIWGLVQKKVRAEVSGKIFVSDPHLGNSILIITQYGSFQENYPYDYYQVWQAGEKMVKNVGTQKTLRVSRDGHTKEIDFLNHHSQQPKLTDREILELADIAWKIKNQLFLPQIIEWDLENNAFLIRDVKPQTNQQPSYNYG